MSDPFIGQVVFFPYNFAPVGWAMCDGSQMLISQYSALYALLGAQFGTSPNPTSTFLLPDLRSRAAAGAGGGSWSNGTKNGVESVALTQNQYPVHSHTLSQLSMASTANTPATGMAFAQYQPGAKAGGLAGTMNTTLSPSAISNSGGSYPHENRQPLLALNACIALDGVFPTFD